MSKFQDSIDVAVPVRTAYDQWTQFEEFPRFMEGVESVRQIDDRCRVTLQIDYEPEGAVQTVGDVLGVVKLRVKGDLKRFEAFIEQRGSESGAWRGTLPNRDERRGL